MNKFTTIALVVLIVLLAIVTSSFLKQKKETQRLTANQRSLFEKATYYRTKDSLSAASVERLQLTVAEVKKYNEGLVKTCDDLGIKLKRVLSASTTATAQNYNVISVLRDSIVVRDSLVVDTLRCISYKDAWLRFEACSTDGISYNTSISTIDTLTTIAHRVPRKFLFFRWGTKAIRQEVISKNPNAKIYFTEYVEVK